MAVSLTIHGPTPMICLLRSRYVSGSVMQVTKTPETVPKPWPRGYDSYSSHISAAYPGAQGRGASYIFSECMDAVADGEADCTFLNYYQA